MEGRDNFMYRFSTVQSPKTNLSPSQNLIVYTTNKIIYKNECFCCNAKLMDDPISPTCRHPPTPIGPILVTTTLTHHFHANLYFSENEDGFAKQQIVVVENAILKDDDADINETAMESAVKDAGTCSSFKVDEDTLHHHQYPLRPGAEDC